MLQRAIDGSVAPRVSSGTNRPEHLVEALVLEGDDVLQYGRWPREA